MDEKPYQLLAHARDPIPATAGGDREVVESTSPNPWTAKAEEYWPDMEGLDYRDTVTDFELPQGTFFDCAVVHLHHQGGASGRIASVHFLDARNTWQALD